MQQWAAKESESNMELLIEDATPELSEYLTDFCAHVCTELDMPEHPDMTFVEKTGATSFGSYRPADGSIIVATGGRHVADILRTLAHEIIHDAQHLNGEPDLPLDELEYEANAMAGMLMRDWNKLHPELYGANEAEPTHASEEGESQGAVFPDPTRPSGPIEMGEDIIIELSSKTLSSYKRKANAHVRWLKVAKPVFDWKWKNATPGNPKTMQRQLQYADPNAVPKREQGIKTAEKKLQARYALAEAKIKESDSDALKVLKLQNQALRAFPSSPRQQEIQKQIEMLRKKMKKEGTPQYHQTLKEDGVVNSAGSGAIAGLGVGPQGEPGVHPKKKKTPILQPLARRKTFATLREEVKDPAVEARKKLATQKIPVDAKTLLARRKLVAQIDAKKKGNLP